MTIEFAIGRKIGILVSFHLDSTFANTKGFFSTQVDPAVFFKTGFFQKYHRF